MKKLMLAIAPVVALGTASMFATFGSASAQTVGRTTSVKPGVFRNSAPVAVGAPVVTDDLMNTDVQGRTNLRFTASPIWTLDRGRRLRSTGSSIIPIGPQRGPRSH